MDTTAASGRTASAPGYGAGRDAFWMGVIAWVAASVAAKVTSGTGDAQAGEIAAQGVQVYGPAAVGAFTAIVAGAVTGLRKAWHELIG